MSEQTSNNAMIQRITNKSLYKSYRVPGRFRRVLSTDDHHTWAAKSVV